MNTNKVTCLSNYRNAKVIGDVNDALNQVVIDEEPDYEEYMSVHDTIDAFADELEYLKEFGLIENYSVEKNSKNQIINISITPTV
jgi:hypothetical protein